MAAVDLFMLVASQASHSDVNQVGHHRADFRSCASGRRAGRCLEKSSLRLQVENDIIVMYAAALASREPSQKTRSLRLLAMMGRGRCEVVLLVFRGMLENRLAVQRGTCTVLRGLIVSML